MEIVLLERVERLGQMGDVVRVKPGFARNFLLPQGKALRATKENMAVFESRRAQLEAENLRRKDEAETVAERMDGLTVVLIRQAGGTNQLYGSVTGRDIAEAIRDAGYTIHARQVLLERAIKELGMHEVRVALHPEVSITVTANVARTVEEAAVQAEGGVVEQEEAGFTFDPDIDFEELGTLPDDDRRPVGDPGENPEGEVN
ncbi:MAG: 50S ribosomal protein L9 [Alphaproteobacteria bacterium]|nr:50S ribosomal protein L9 [Alphaproteobacteria bacterium]MCB9928649.1 50S ribosomal protein L9 [Alphaproteobacteria bacterium]